MSEPVLGFRDACGAAPRDRRRRTAGATTTTAPRHRRVLRARTLAFIAGALVASLAFAAGVTAPSVVHAHDRSISHSTWRLDDAGADVEVRFSAFDLSAVPEAVDPTAAARYASERLRLTRDGVPCPLDGEPRVVAAPDGWHVFAWRIACPAGGRVVESTLLREVKPSHLHFARLRAGERVVERVLAENDTGWAVDDDGSGASHVGTSFASYVLLGVEHIVSGWDHLAFVAALLLLASTLREVATLVTAFTLAHSVTLALAVLGLVRPEAAGVESLIGFSIALVAAENAWLLAGRDRAIPIVSVAALLLLALLSGFGVGTLRPLALLGLGLFTYCHFALLDRSQNPARLRAAIAFAFGLVHGFGFAGALAEMELPRERLVHALVGFNVGVELGQLAVVALLWPLLRALASWNDGRIARAVAEVGSAAVCGLGLFWFLTRALG